MSKIEDIVQAYFDFRPVSKDSEDNYRLLIQLIYKYFVDARTANNKNPSWLEYRDLLSREGFFEKNINGGVSFSIWELQMVLVVLNEINAIWLNDDDIPLKNKFSLNSRKR